MSKLTDAEVNAIITKIAELEFALSKTPLPRVNRRANTQDRINALKRQLPPVLPPKHQLVTIELF